VNLVAPWGFYGWGNIGDEATLQGFARVVALAGNSAGVWVSSRDPAHTAAVEPAFRYYDAVDGGWRRWWADRRASAIVVPGGTPIQDSLGEWPFCDIVPLLDAARVRGLPCAFIGTGTERLSRPESLQIMAEKVAPYVRSWTVRSEPDLARLTEYGVPPERVAVAADMAWLLSPVDAEWGRLQLQSWGVSTGGLVVGVNVMNEKAVRERYGGLFATLARFLDTLVERHDATILFIANAINDKIGFDRSASMDALASMRHRGRAFLVPNVYWPPQRIMSLLANCSAAISMRYHFCLFAALQGVPFIALQRSDKVADLSKDLDWPLGTDLGVDTPRLLAMFEQLNAHQEPLRAHLRVRISTLRDRAARNVEALRALRDA
jgi:polysaccharide pyruvyl transferase WcaK-like protein